MKSNVLAIVLVAVLCNACFMRSKQDDSLRALVILNESLEESAEASFNKSESLYTEINFLKNEQEERYGDLYDDVMKINKRSNELCGDIERLKQEIIARAEHLEYDQDVRIELRDVRHKNNKYAAPELLIGDGGPMKGDSLEAWIGDYQYFMLHFVDPLDVTYRNIKDQLNTSVVIEDEVYSFWIEDYCVHVPLAGTIAMLTKLQSDIRYTEAEVLNYLANDYGDGMHVEVVTVVVNQNNSLVKRGGLYQAEVYMAAMDTISMPTVYYSMNYPYFDSIQDPGGNMTFKMIGTLGVDYDTLPCVSGRSVLVIDNQTSIGKHEWGGLYVWRTKDGERMLPFTAEYTVVQ